MVNKKKKNTGKKVKRVSRQAYAQELLAKRMTDDGYVIHKDGTIHRVYDDVKHYGQVPRGWVVYRVNGVGHDHAPSNLVALPKVLLIQIRKVQREKAIRFTKDQLDQVAAAAAAKTQEYVDALGGTVRHVATTRPQRQLLVKLRKQIMKDYAGMWEIEQQALKALKVEVKVPDYFSDKGEVTKVAKTRKTVTVWRIKRGEVDGAVREVRL
jgi:hypothetical protein